MSNLTREIVGHLTIKSSRDETESVIHAGNLAFKVELTQLVSFWWTASDQPSLPFNFWPWRIPSGLSNANQNVTHGLFVDSNAYTVGYNNSGSFNSLDYSRSRYYTTSPSSFSSSFDPSFVIGAVGVENANAGSTNLAWQSNLVCITDVPTTQLGPAYIHPVYTGTCTVTSSSPWVTALSMSGGYPNHYYESAYSENASVFRIESGPDKGVYYVQDVDPVNSRLSLRTSDGHPFSPVTTQTSLSCSVGCRTSYFNEVSVIPNGTGSVQFSGVFSPGVANNSYICKVHFEKSGNCSAANQTGSYWFSLRTWISGDGTLANSSGYGEDAGQLWDGRLYMVSGVNAFGYTRWQGPANSSVTPPNLAGGCGGVVFDQANQRMWFTSTDGTQGDIDYWYYKTPEGMHEVGATGGSPGDPVLSPNPSLTGTVPRFIKIGSDNTVYVANTVLNGVTTATAQSGLLSISTLFATSLSRVTTEWGLATTALLMGMCIDTTRFRTGTSGDVTTTSSTNQLNSASGSFSTRDLGRLINVSGGTNDNGVYKISSINSTSQVVVTTPTGGGVSFTGGTGGTFNIGDRIYLFWGDTTTVSNSVYYVESLQLGTLLSFSVTLTNGKKVGSHVNQDGRTGGHTPACVDPVTGVLYWATIDTQVQLNRFDPSSNTYNELALSYFNGLNGGSGTAANPSELLSMAININSAFRELWLGVDIGIIKIPTIDSQTWTSPTFQRYVGAATSPTYAKPANMWKTTGSNSAIFSHGVNYYCRQFDFGIDGRVFAMITNANPTGDSPELVAYIRDADNFAPSFGFSSDLGSTTTFLGAFKIDPYGGAFMAAPWNNVSNGNVAMVMFGAQIHYQWIGSAWVAQEVVRGPVPDSGTSSPGLLAKPLHTAAASLTMGVLVAFTPQGGATPPNDEFLGRLGQVTGYGGNDGVMDSSTGIPHTFNGSGFSSADVGRLLYITSGSQIGVYAITAFGSSTSVTVRQYGNGSFTGNGSSSLNYTVWDQNGQSNAGPEVCSLYWANGFGKDNTQDIDNIYYDFFTMKTVLSEQAESIKFCSPILGAPGSAATSLVAGINGASGTGLANGVSVYFEYMAKSSATYGPGVPAMRAVPATGIFSGDGTQILDGMIDKSLIGTNGHAYAYSSSPDNDWYGNLPSTTQGNAWVFDLGAPVQVGSILVRGTTNGGSTLSQLMYTDTENAHGLIAEWLNEVTAGIAPANASSVRLSGVSNLSLVINNTTISLVGGNFLGSSAVFSNTTGSTVSGASGFSDTTNSPFTVPASGNLGSLGMILQLTSGSDVGYFRIIAVNSTSSVTIRALNQTAYLFAGSATGTLSYSVWNGTQEEDMVQVTTGGHTQHLLCVERLLQATTPTSIPVSAQVRIPPNETVSSMSWNNVIPTWNVVKRIEYSVIGQPPEVTNNGTWMSEDGYENQHGSSTQSFKIFASLSGLPTYLATGRYWKLAMMPRWNNNASTSDFQINSVTFYDPSGNVIGMIPYNRLDTVATQTNFYAAQVYRSDFIQVADYANPQTSSSNGLAALGGATGNTVTLSGSNAFVGFQVRPGGSTGTPTTASNVFTCTSADPPFTASDVGRTLKITNGNNAGGSTSGYYRITTFNSATSVNVSSLAGNAVSFTAETSPPDGSITFIVCEGINVGTSTPDYIAFAATDLRTGGNTATIAEYPILSITDNGQTLTLANGTYLSLTSQHFEIRRRANIDTGSASTNGSVTARLIYSANVYPGQSGDICQDSRGFLRFWPYDIGNGNQRTNGQTVTMGGNVFNGSGFTADDVGRILVIQTGADKGAYQIGTYNSTTQVVLINAYTGGAVAFNASASSLNYVVYGERRFRASRYTTVLRA